MRKEADSQRYGAAQTHSGMTAQLLRRLEGLLEEVLPRHVDQLGGQLWDLTWVCHGC